MTPDIEIKAMPYFRLTANDQFGQPTDFTCEVYDQVIDKNGNLQIFSYRGPVSGNMFHVHLVQHSHSFADTANTIFGSGKHLRTSQRLLTTFEQLAREKRWYDAAKYPSFQAHAGTVGVLLGSATALYAFLKEHHYFDVEGYYTGDMSLAIPYIINTNDPTTYLP